MIQQNSTVDNPDGFSTTLPERIRNLKQHIEHLEKDILPGRIKAGLTTEENAKILVDTLTDVLKDLYDEHYCGAAVHKQLSLFQEKDLEEFFDDLSPEPNWQSPPHCSTPNDPAL